MHTWILFLKSKEITARTSGKVHIGMTALDQWPEEVVRFDSRDAAIKKLRECRNDYWYNGSGYGRATEWWLEEVGLDEDGEIEESFGEEMAPTGNYEEYYRQWIGVED